MPPHPTPPLPRRHGLEPARLRLPDVTDRWATIRDHLVERLPRESPDHIDAMLRDGGIVTMDGPVDIDTPYLPGSVLWLHRPLPEETPIPFDITVVHHDDNILVADKPHFLATIPRGRHILQTALVRLRNELDLPDLVPAHRLDRATAGLLLFVVNARVRGAYQTMFAKRLVRKEYRAVAPYDPAVSLPVTVHSRIVKQRFTITAEEVPGEPNAETRIELLEHRNGLGRYRLHPHTGRTHQLRLHMSRLGIPILNDDFYPTYNERPLDDFTRPLQLLAATVEFTDPLTRINRRFDTTRTLDSWGTREETTSS